MDNKKYGLLTLSFFLIALNMLTAQTWQRCEPLPVLMQPKAAAVNGKIYAVGREQNRIEAPSTYEYDPAADKWTQKGSMNSKRTDFELVVINGRIFAIGGIIKDSISISEVEEYDIAAGTWIKKKNMPTPRYGMGIIKYDGNIYAIGGGIKYSENYSIKDSASNAVEVYNPNTDTWTQKRNMSRGRIWPAVVTRNDRLFVIAGTEVSGSNWNTVSSLEEFRINENTWQDIVVFSINSVYGFLCQAVVINENIYGIFSTWPTSTTLDTYICEYNTETSPWIEKKHFTPTGDFLKVVIDNKLYLVGGQSGLSTLSNKVIKYDPETNTSSFLPNLSEVKWYPGVTEMNGKIYVIGGQTYSGLTNRVEVYDTKSETDVTVHNYIPKEFSLSQNYPNPFNPETVIGYQLPVTSHVELRIYDMLGREAASLVNDEQSAGKYQVRFDGSNLSNGVYLYRLNATNFTQTNKMVLIK